jgi:hypothetical protein
VLCPCCTSAGFTTPEVIAEETIAVSEVSVEFA